MTTTIKGLMATTPLMLASTSFAREDTEWLVAPYLWYPSISLGQTSGDGSGISGSDLLSKTNALGMLRIEAAHDHWGLTFDYIFLSLADTRSFALPVPLGANVELRGDVDLSVIEFAGFYRPSGSESGINYIAGLRSIEIEKVLLVTPPLGGATQRFEGDIRVTDLMVGARYLHRFNDHWDLTARADFSFGDSEGTFNLLGALGYRFNDLFAINLAYRHASLEYEETADGDSQNTEIELTGPALGFVFRF